MRDPRVVVTGMGLVSPVGNSVEQAWTAIKAGQSGIDTITQFDAADLPITFAGEVKDFDPVAIFGAREARRTDRTQQFALYAADQALRDSGLIVNDANRYEVGVTIGTGMGGMASLISTLDDFTARGPRGVSPLAIPQILFDTNSAKVSIEFGLRGPNYDITSACATGTNCIGDAADLIRLGRARVMLAGGTEAAILPQIIAGFDNMKAMAHREDDPARASRPFDLDRNGFVIAEGAAVLVLEDLDHALARNARIYAEVAGYGHTSDGHHVTAPLDDGASAARAIRLALADAGLPPEAIDHINAHATSTPLNDSSETLAIKTALGEHAYSVPVSGTKSMTGHLLGAAGAVEAVFSILAIRDNFVPPTINLDSPDPACDLDYVPHIGRACRVDQALNYSAGFGGHNLALIFSRFAG